MKDKCEICGIKSGLQETFCQPVTLIETKFSATLCADCEKKYRRTWFHHYYAVNTLAENLVREYMMEHGEKEESAMNTMKVSYNGFTGELYKLERRSRFLEESFYDLEIFDVEKKCNMQFFGVKLEDVKFLGGAVTFGG